MTDLNPFRDSRAHGRSWDAAEHLTIEELLRIVAALPHWLVYSTAKVWRNIQT